MGSANRVPTAAEQSRMNAIVSQAVRDGAVGFSTGLWYVPGTYSKTPEVAAMAQAAKAAGAQVYATHMRDEGMTVEDAIREALEIGRQSSLPVQISHFIPAITEVVAAFHADLADITSSPHPPPSPTQ